LSNGRRKIQVANPYVLNRELPWHRKAGVVDLDFIGGAPAVRSAGLKKPGSTAG
jgi:hypothetical protein